MEPRISVVTLGVKNLEKSFLFYKDTVGLPSKDGIQGDIVFFQLNHLILSLHPKEMLAKDARVANDGTGFSGITLAHNVKTKEEVDSLIKKLRSAGATITKEPQDTEWGGYDAYFQDPDGYLWEICFNPFFWVE